MAILPIIGSAVETFGPALVGLSVDLFNRFENRLTEHRTATVQLMEGAVTGMARAVKTRDYNFTPRMRNGVIGAGTLVNLKAAVKNISDTMAATAHFTVPILGDQFDSDLAWGRTYADLYVGRSKDSSHTFSAVCQAVAGAEPGGGSYAAGVCNAMMVAINNISPISNGSLFDTNRETMWKMARSMYRISSIGLELAGHYASETDQLSAVSSVHGFLARQVAIIHKIIDDNLGPMDKVFIGSSVHDKQVSRGVSGLSWHVIHQGKDYYGFTSMVTFHGVGINNDLFIYNHGFTDGTSVSFCSEIKRIDPTDVNKTDLPDFDGLGSNLFLFQSPCIILDAKHEVAVFGHIFPDRVFPVKDVGKNSHSSIVEFFLTAHPMSDMSINDWFAVACNGYDSVQMGTLAEGWTLVNNTTYSESPNTRGNHLIGSIDQKHTDSITPAKSGIFSTFVSSAFTELKKLSFEDVKTVGSGIYDFFQSLVTGSLSG